VHDRQRHHRLLNGAAGQLVAVHRGRRVAADGRVHLVRNGYGHHDAVVVGRGRRLFDFHGLGGRGGRVRLLRRGPDHLHRRRVLQRPAARAVRVPGHRRAAPARLQVVQPLLPGRRRLAGLLRHGVAEVEMIHFRQHLLVVEVLRFGVMVCRVLRAGNAFLVKQLRMTMGFEQFCTGNRVKQKKYLFLKCKRRKKFNI